MSTWLSNAPLRLVSLQARGLFMDLTQYATAAGVVACDSEEKLARLVSSSVEEVAASVAELSDAGLLSRGDAGFIVVGVVEPADAEPKRAGSSMKTAIPPVPYESIVEAYHAALPDLPRVVKLTSARKDSVRARWREACENAKSKGRPWETVDDGVGYFARFFKFVATSCPFLTGGGAARENGQPFVADFEWLMKDGNFVKVVEGKYSKTDG